MTPQAISSAGVAVHVPAVVQAIHGPAQATSLMQPACETSIQTPPAHTWPWLTQSLECEQACRHRPDTHSQPAAQAPSDAHRTSATPPERTQMQAVHAHSSATRPLACHMPSIVIDGVTTSTGGALSTEHYRLRAARNPLKNSSLNGTR